MAAEFTDEIDTQQSRDEDSIHVLSVSWEKGKLAAAYYNLSNLELFVTYETLDLAPQFSAMCNLVRQLKPQHILASGPNNFLQEILPLCNLPKDSDLRDYRVTTVRRATLSPLVIYPQTEKNLSANRHRITAMILPGMSPRFSPIDRRFFIESVLPLHQNLVVHSLGVLLEFIDANRQRLFLENGSGTIISDLKVYLLESEVSMDDFTVNSLQIISDGIHHPSTYKKPNNSALTGSSIYRLMDNCSSTIATKTLKMLLSHPIRDIAELNCRYNTIEWCLMPQNAERLQQIQRYLRNVGEIGLVFRNILHMPHKMKNWHQFKKIVYNAYMVLKCCQDIGAAGAPNTLIADLAGSVDDESYIRNVLHSINRTVDLEEGLSQRKFSVKLGLDADLDDKKQMMVTILDTLQEAVQTDVNNLPHLTNQLICYYIPEIGYVMKITQEDDRVEPPLVDQMNDNFTLILRSDDSHYFRNILCDDFNKKYGHLYLDIQEHESRICQRLIRFLTERLAVIQQIVKLCAQLDCIMSFAQVAGKMSLVKPEIVADKSMKVTKGRHILWEVRQNIVPNDSEISLAGKQFITIVSAPNSSGKSVYLKQVALIAFLAHVGSFVPASRAQVGLLDSIYSRINCPESAYGSNSSFLNEVQQLGKVMSNSTDKSLILIDEFGKGTNLLEGQALLASCIDDLTQRQDKCPITLISTHFAQFYDCLKNKDAVVMKTFETVCSPDGEMKSTFRLKSGRATPKYAMQIGKVKQFLENMDKM